MRLFKILIFCFFSKIFLLKTRNSPPSIFLKFCTVSGIVAFFKRNNFRVKIRFSQVRHSISDFCFKRPVFFLCDFKNLFHRSLSSIFARNETFWTPQGFRHYATYRRPSKKFSKKIFFNFLFFVEKDGFFTVFSWGRMVFETYGYFLALYIVKLMKV